MSEHIVPTRVYFVVYAILMGLLLLTLGAAYMDLGPFNFPISIGIAIAKALLVILIFMHVRYDKPLVWVFASAAFLWLAILIAGALNDYLTRGLLNITGK